MVGITHPLPYHHTHKKKYCWIQFFHFAFLWTILGSPDSSLFIIPGGFSDSPPTSFDSLSIRPTPHPTEHKGILTTPTQRFQEDFSIHLQRYSIFQHFAPFSNPSEHREILTTPTQQFRSIFGLVSPLSLRRGSISNLRSSIGVVTGIMFQKALWNSPPKPATVEQEPFFHSSTLPAISMDFQKIKKKQSNWHYLPDRPARTSQWGGATRHRPVSRQRPLNPSSTVSSKYHIHQFYVNQATRPPKSSTA